MLLLGFTLGYAVGSIVCYFIGRHAAIKLFHNNYIIPKTPQITDILVKARDELAQKIEKKEKGV